MGRVMTGILGILLLGSAVWADTLSADPSNYKTVAGQLQPGDTLELAGGDYANGLTLRLHGTADNWITIRGPESGTPARFLGDTSVSRNPLRRETAE